MKLSAIALDYDGTIAVGGMLDGDVRQSIAAARQHGVVVVLVTGRRLADLHDVAGDLSCFDIVVGENGAVLEFPATGRRAVIGHAPNPAFLEEVQRRRIPFVAGESVVEADAQWAVPILEVIRSLEQPLVLAFNRGRLMVLPPGIAKSSGLRLALAALRVSVHNTIGVGDAENDHDLLDACEVGAAVAWGSVALKAVADEIIAGSGPHAVADYIRRVTAQSRLSAAQMGRRRLHLGHQHDGEDVSLAVRGRTILIAGEPGTGKSWLAGLVCEQSILQGYCLCVIDPEGDYRALEALPNVIVLGGDDPPPQARDLVRAFRYPDVSVVIDLSKISHHAKREYVTTLLPLLTTLRRNTGLPHKILLDEAHYFLDGPDVRRLIDLELSGYIFVTYRISNLPASLRAAEDVVVMVTRETDPEEARALLAMCRPQPCAELSFEIFRNLPTTEAALLPGAAEAHGRVRRFRLAPRLTTHVRHRTKYLDMPVLESQAFVFTSHGRPAARAQSLREFARLLSSLPVDHVVDHLKHHDFSRWIDGVFRDRPLAAHLRNVEETIASDDAREVANAIAQAIRARYDTAPQELAGGVQPR